MEELNEEARSVVSRRCNARLDESQADFERMISIFAFIDKLINFSSFLHYTMLTLPIPILYDTYSSSIPTK